MPEQIPENDLAVNEATRLAFQQGHVPLHGAALYVLEAMLWGLNNDAAGWADGTLKWQMEDQVGLMLIWKPARVMRFMYDDGEGNFDADAMDEAGGCLEGMSPTEVASSLLETLSSQMD